MAILRIDWRSKRCKMMSVFLWASNSDKKLALGLGLAATLRECSNPSHVQNPSCTLCFILSSMLQRLTESGSQERQMQALE